MHDGLTAKAAEIRRLGSRKPCKRPFSFSSLISPPEGLQVSRSTYRHNTEWVSQNRPSIRGFMTVRLSEPSNPLSPIQRLWHALPKGHSLDGVVWVRRHRRILWLPWIQGEGAPLYVLLMSYRVWFGLSGSTTLVGLAALMAYRCLAHRAACPLCRPRGRVAV